MKSFRPLVGFSGLGARLSVLLIVGSVSTGATAVAVTPGPTITTAQPGEPTPTPTTSTSGPTGSTEAAVQAALQPGECYAVAGDAIYVSPVVAQQVGPKADLSSPNEAPSEVVTADPNYAIVDESAPIPAEAAGIDAADTVATAASIPWAACGAGDSKYKLVKDYSRQMMSGVSGASAHLRCGTAENWSYRHIKYRHASQWQAKANYIVQDWRSFTDWSMRQTLSKPCSKYRQLSNDTLQYVTPIQIKDNNGRIYHTFGSRVVVARASQNVITAYPQSATC